MIHNRGTLRQYLHPALNQCSLFDMPSAPFCKQFPTCRSFVLFKMYLCKSHVSKRSSHTRFMFRDYAHSAIHQDKLTSYLCALASLQGRAAFRKRSMAFHGALWFSTVILNVFTHRIRHCCFLHNTFPIMSYDTARLAGPLGRIVL